MLKSISFIALSILFSSSSMAMQDEEDKSNSLPKRPLYLSMTDPTTGETVTVKPRAILVISIPHSGMHRPYQSMITDIVLDEKRYFSPLFFVSNTGFKLNPNNFPLRLSLKHEGWMVEEPDCDLRVRAPIDFEITKDEFYTLDGTIQLNRLRIEFDLNTGVAALQTTYNPGQDHLSFSYTCSMQDSNAQ